jgi:5-methyltetrahydropteroyltriglutamate--homocysteine methyltransferase
MPTEYHAEHVGSLLRPPWLLAARAARRRGELSAAELRSAEDRAAVEAIELQRQAGMPVFTDGEVRRENWMDGLLASIGGVVGVERPHVDWHRDGGTPPAEETNFVTVAANAAVTQRAHHTAAEAAFLARHAPGPFKITMISSSMGRLIWDPGLSASVYPTPADLVRDLAALQAKEIEGLIDQGVTWIQLDSLNYNQVFDAQFRAQVGVPGLSPADILAASVAIDSELVRAAKRKDPGVTVGMHICRGNNRSAWMARGSYEPIAERLFGEVGVDRFLLEYDTERAGGFEPLRFIRPGTTVVLGLVSSKVPQLESPDELRRRIDEAAAYVSLQDLALSPQCGFASTSQGNLLTIDEERRKLALVADTATKVWG